jgi:hypothetical protein
MTAQLLFSRTLPRNRRAALAREEASEEVFKVNDSFNQKRLGAAMILLFTLATLANHYFEWGFYQRFSKGIVVGAFVLLFAYMAFVGPSLEEIVEYRKNSSARIRESKGGVPWLYLLTLVTISLTFVLIGPVLKLMRAEVIQMRDWIQLLFIELIALLAGIWSWYQLKRLRGRNSRDD